MNFKIMILEKIVTMLTSGDLVRVAKQLVENIDKENIAGKEKRAWVESELKKFFREFSNFAIDLVVMIAVAAVKSKLGELEIKEV